MLVNNWRKCRKVLFSILISIKAEVFVCVAKPVQHRATPLCAEPLALARVRAHALKIAQDCSKSARLAVPERCAWTLCLNAARRHLTLTACSVLRSFFRYCIFREIFTVAQSPRTVGYMVSPGVISHSLWVWVTGNQSPVDQERPS